MLRVGRGSTPPASPAKRPPPVEDPVEKAMAAARSEVESTVLRGADDLTYKLGAWRTVGEATYGSAPASGQLTVTVLAATGLACAEPYWIATVAGAAAETGPPTHFQVAHFQEAIGGNSSSAAPRGAPSWSAEPLLLPVHDVAADLILLLCEDGLSGRRCLGRVVLPLVDLLPLNPLADLVGAQPTPRQVWAQVFPPASELAVGQVDARLAAPVAGVPGVGMVPPAVLPGRVLVRCELALQRSLLGAYLFAPPFDPSAVRSIDEHTGQPAVPPEALLVAAGRLMNALGGAPAAVRLAAERPWSAGGGLAFLAGWLCFATPLPLLPWWMLAAWLFNGYAQRILRKPPQPWEPERAEGFRLFGGSSATEKLEASQASLLPLLRWLELAASMLERISAAPAADDPRASVLCALPAIVLCAFSSFGLALLWALVWLLGGLRSGLFLITCASLLINAASFHRNELLAWLGAREAMDGGGDGEANPRSPPPRGVGAPAAIAGTPFAAAAALLPRGAVDSASVSFGGAAGGRWLNPEQRNAVGGAVGKCFQKIRSSIGRVTGNLWLRLPDGPTLTHRALARAACQAGDAARRPASPEAKPAGLSA